MYENSKDLTPIAGFYGTFAYITLDWKIKDRIDLKFDTGEDECKYADNTKILTDSVEFEKKFDLDELTEALKNAKDIIVEDDPKHDIYPLAINANGHDEVYVGRLRRDFSIESGINMWVVADNLRKGAASNAIQIVEELIRLDKIDE